MRISQQTNAPGSKVSQFHNSSFWNVLEFYHWPFLATVLVYSVGSNSRTLWAHPALIKEECRSVQSPTADSKSLYPPKEGKNFFRSGSCQQIWTCVHLLAILNTQKENGNGEYRFMFILPLHYRAGNVRCPSATDNSKMVAYQMCPGHRWKAQRKAMKEWTTSRLVVHEEIKEQNNSKIRVSHCGGRFLNKKETGHPAEHQESRGYCLLL